MWHNTDLIRQLPLHSPQASHGEDRAHHFSRKLWTTLLLHLLPKHDTLKTVLAFISLPLPPPFSSQLCHFMCQPHQSLCPVSQLKYQIQLSPTCFSHLSLLLASWTHYSLFLPSFCFLWYQGLRFGYSLFSLSSKTFSSVQNTSPVWKVGGGGSHMEGRRVSCVAIGAVQQAQDSGSVERERRVHAQQPTLSNRRKTSWMAVRLGVKNLCIVSQMWWRLLVDPSC